MNRSISEFAINMCANGMALLQDDNLHNLHEHIDNAPPFHIYFVGSRPRITVGDLSVSSPDAIISGTIFVQVRSDLLRFPFKLASPEDAAIDTAVCEWPHSVLDLYEQGRRVLSVKTSLLASMLAYSLPGIEDHLDLEVLYIGQAFGSFGERQAQDRLQSHSTLQRILGETSRRHPDREVWLVLAHFEPALMMSFDGRGATPDESMLGADDARLERFLRVGVSEQQQVNFAEAALIRYFAPTYNTQFRERFPDPSHRTYAECYDLDVNSVCAEVSTNDLRCRLYSESVERRWLHLAMYALHDPRERVFLLDPLLPGHMRQGIRLRGQEPQT